MIDLRPRLKAAKIRQRELAARLGVSPGRLSRILTDLAAGEIRNVPAERARDLAAALDLPRGVIRPDLWPMPAEAEAEAFA